MYAKSGTGPWFQFSKITRKVNQNKPTTQKTLFGRDDCMKFVVKLSRGNG
jgi:hypothetical protein